MNLSTSWYHSDFVARPNVKCPGGHFFKSGQLSKNTQNIFPGGQIFCDTVMFQFFYFLFYCDCTYLSSDHGSRETDGTRTASSKLKNKSQDFQLIGNITNT